MLRSHELLVLRSHFRIPARRFPLLFCARRALVVLRTPALARISAYPLAVSCTHACCFALAVSRTRAHLFSARPHSLAFPHTRSPFPARTLAVLRSLFPARALVVLRTPALAGSRTPTPARISVAFPAFPLRFPHARSLFSARPRPLAVYRPLAASCFLLRLTLPLRLAGKAEPGAERDKNWI
ncbi:hypothetical protein B0H13DRAFT_2352310 [Mycena leptocephala]|nr:hypothetical protein B0H13DRAFT_2352310 [Mycena leptocephala]